jgi:hypothetical protein
MCWSAYVTRLRSCGDVLPATDRGVDQVVDGVKQLVGADARALQSRIQVPEGQGHILQLERRVLGDVEQPRQDVIHLLAVAEERPERDASRLHCVVVVVAQLQGCGPSCQQAQRSTVDDAAQGEQPLPHKEALAVGRGHLDASDPDRMPELRDGHRLLASRCEEAADSRQVSIDNDFFDRHLLAEEPSDFLSLNLGASKVDFLLKFVCLLCDCLHDVPFCAVLRLQEPHRIDPRKHGNFSSCSY